MLILGHLLSTDMILGITEDLCVNLFQNLCPYKRRDGYGELGSSNILCIKSEFISFRKFSNCKNKLNRKISISLGLVVEINSAHRIFFVCTLLGKYYSGNQIRMNEMGGACSRYGKQKKCLQSFH